MIAVADEERAGEPEYLMPAGLAQNAESAAGFGACEHAILALMNRPPPPKDKAAQEQQAPWSIRGVSQVARVRAAQAAARRRMTSGAWVDHAIISYADRDAGIEPPARRAPEPPPEASRVPEKTMRLVEDLARRIGETQAPDTPAEAVADRADELERVDRRISELAERVDEHERKHEQRLAALISALTIVANQLRPAGEPEPRGDEPAAGPPRAPPAEPAKPEDRLSEAERAFWKAIKDSANPEDYEAYLETFPGGVFASLARKRGMRAAAPRPGGPEQQPGAPGPSASERQPGQPGKAPVVSSPWLDFDRLAERAQQNTERSKRRMEKLKRKRALNSRLFRDRDTHSRPIRHHPTARPRWTIMAWISATRLAKACGRSSGGKLLQSVLFRRLGTPASRPSVSNYARRASRRSASPCAAAWPGRPGPPRRSGR